VLSFSNVEHDFLFIKKLKNIEKTAQSPQRRRMSCCMVTLR
jgi:hypothetical protein